MLVIAALSLPLTPALLFAGISRLPVAEVLLALWLGKLVKYTTYAWLVSAFPEQFVRRAHRRVGGLGDALTESFAVRRERRTGRRDSRDELARIEPPRAKPIAQAEELNQRVTVVGCGLGLNR